MSHCHFLRIVAVTTIACTVQYANSHVARVGTFNNAKLPDVSFDGNDQWQFPAVHNMTRNGYNKTSTEVCFSGNNIHINALVLTHS